jgi:hypothetical protein
LPRWNIKAHRDSVERRDYDNEARVRESQMRAGSEDESAQHLRRLCPDQDGSFGVTVRQRAAPKRKNHHRRRTDRRNGAEQKSRAGNFINKPAHGGLL